MNMGKYAYMGLWVKYALGKCYYVSKIPPVHQKNQIMTVSEFLCTWHLTGLLSKKFRLLPHCYNLVIWPSPGILTAAAQGWRNRTLIRHERAMSTF